MDSVVQKFITKSIQEFEFLEREYEYKRIKTGIENQDYYPDAQAVIQYISKNVGIEVYWYFASAVIGVVFIEVKNGVFPGKKAFFGEAKDAAKAVDLYTLAQFLKQSTDLFLLKETDIVTFSKIKNREKIINENMTGVVENIAVAVKKIATNIIAGDTSIFPEVIKYRTELMKKHD